jgi:ribokinase
MTDGGLVDPPHVICLGDVMVDVVAHLSGPLAVGSDTPAPIRLYGGGSAANTASWLRFFGGSASLIARVGDDLFGAWSRTQLDERIAAGLIVDRHRPTGTCLVLVGPDGERTMVPDAGANGSLDPADVDAVDFAPGRYLHVSGYALFGDARPAALHALDRARAVGMRISVGAASAGPLQAAGAENFLDWIGADVLLFANLDEAWVLTGSDDPRAAAAALAARVGRVSVTCGSGGSVFSDGVAVLGEPADPVEVIDTTGAGDAYAAGMLHALGQGLEPARALAVANAAGAQACRHHGGRPHEPVQLP